MKKLTKILSMALVAMMGAVMVACEEPTPTPPGPEPTPEPTAPTISVEAVDAGEDYLVFNVISENVKRAHYVAIPEDIINEVTVDADFVLSSSNMVPNPNTTCEVKFEGRTPETKYFVYAAGIAADNKTKVLSECVEMTTKAHEYTTTALPEATSCDIRLTALASVDRYAFSLSDEGGNFLFDFYLYTESGCNGAIPTGKYTTNSNSAPNTIDLNSIYLEINGLLTAISEGSMDVELYEGGTKIKLNGSFKLVTNDTATFEYDGAVTISGINDGGSEDGDIVFTRTYVATSSEPGWFEIQFQPAEGNSMLDLQFYGDPTKDYLASGKYCVFGSKEAAEAAGSVNSWIYVMEGAPAGSFYQDDMNIPSIILTGTESYVDVSTNMNKGEDWYEITFSLKVYSLGTMQESVLKATYTGPLGFTVSDATPTMRMETMYVDITSENNSHSLFFYGGSGYTTMSVTIEGALPEVGGDYQWFDIVEGGFSDMYAGASNHPITNGRIAIKRFPDAEDASDDSKVKEFYGFKIEGKLENLTTTDQESGVSSTRTYDLVGDWKSFETDYVSGY